ncbi:anti-sigma B factor antagonist [Thermocatellispora tengchongensis]|uniref:Anti-sigma B factor antagonist n=1 Tax=Thermocatellispora tengchongensis TaxID=1073253 RepID=A0A840PD69_9ACTN|nr:STAS domain-containing protein [Thermocatellispora tengchongensis]MBB5135883.1 anti-sigma B factor antagonist [Thermocatellispora tengchongensis]
MSTLVHFVTHATGEHAELAVHGEIDASNTALLHDAIQQAVHGGRAVLVIDLTAITYLDSAGINTLFRIHRDLTRTGVELHLVAPVGCCSRYALNLVCAQRLVPIHDSRPELRSLPVARASGAAART